MSNSEQERDRWEPCPVGTLARTVRGIQARQRDRRRAKVVGAAGGVVVLLFAATMIAQQFGQVPTTIPGVSKITCAKVQALLPAYVAGHLEAALSTQVRTHLEDCPHCKERHDRVENETALPGQRIGDAPQLALRT